MVTRLLLVNEYPLPNFLCRSLKDNNFFSKSYWCEMGFFALACVKDKFRNRLNAIYAVRLANCNVKPRF